MIRHLSGEGLLLKDSVTRGKQVTSEPLLYPPVKWGSNPCSLFIGTTDEIGVREALFKIESLGAPGGLSR